jgi:hypothetical protein
VVDDRAGDGDALLREPAPAPRRRSETDEIDDIFS